MPRIKLAEFIERKMEAAVELEVDGGDPIIIPPAEIWPDAVENLEAGANIVALGRAVIGDAEYDRFVAAGGSARIFNQILTEMNGATPGES